MHDLGEVDGEHDSARDVDVIRRRSTPRGPIRQKREDHQAGAVHVWLDVHEVMYTELLSTSPSTVTTIALDYLEDKSDGGGCSCARVQPIIGAYKHWYERLQQQVH